MTLVERVPQLVEPSGSADATSSSHSLTSQQTHSPLRFVRREPQGALMKMQSITRWLGFIGSVALGVVAILKGDATTGVGIIAAGFSSASIIPAAK